MAHRFELFAVVQEIGFAAEVDRYGGAVGEACLLNVPVRRKKAMVGHLSVANRANDGTYILIALNKAVLVLVPSLAGEHEHRRCTVEDIEKVPLTPYRR